MHPHRGAPELLVFDDRRQFFFEGRFFHQFFDHQHHAPLGFVDTDGAFVAQTPEEGVLFGQPVGDLVAWADVAANSDAFRRATVLDYWRLLVGEDPRPSEQLEFADLVEGLGSRHDWRIEPMLHDLIDTEAYGAP